MIKKVFIFIFLVAFFLSAEAGNPRYSYMGRSSMFAYQPTLVIPYIHTLRGFAIRHNISYEHLLGKVVTAGVCFDYYTRKIDPRVDDPYLQRFNYRSEGYAAGINVKFFRTNRGFYAPNGEYFKVQLLQSRFATMDVNKGEKFKNASQTDMFIPSVGAGTNYFFNDRCKIGVEVDFNLHKNPDKVIGNNIIKPFYDADWVFSFGMML